MMFPGSEEGLVILGGGLAGLAASMYSGAPIYESSKIVGGVAASHTQDGFTFDQGIHVLQTKNQGVLDLLADIGVQMGSHNRNAHIYSHNCYTAYPFQVNTVGLPIGLRAKCVWDFLHCGKNPQPTNYEEWIFKNLGAGFGEAFLIPYSEKFWTVHPREMTYEWTGNRVPQPSTWQVLRGAAVNKQTNIGRNAIFRYPLNEGGYGAIPNMLSRRVGKVNLGHRATRVDVINRRIQFNGHLEVPYNQLINTIPLPELIRIIPEAPTHVREAVGRLRTNSIFVVNLGIDKPDLSDSHWVHFPEKDIAFFRISYLHNFAPGMAPKGMSSISAEVAYSDHAPIDKNTIVARVIEDLIRAGALGRKDPIVLKTTMDLKYGYCIYDKQRKASLGVVRDWLKSVDILTCGRYGLWAYFWSDEAILSGKRSAEKALERMKESVA